jgi:hypothetical protein
LDNYNRYTLKKLFLLHIQMGFLDFLKGIGHFITSGIQKVAGFAGKVAPVVSSIAGMIPTPLTQGIATAANLVGGVANAVNGTNQTAPDQGGVPPPTAAQTPAGTQAPPPVAGPIM